MWQTVDEKHLDIIYYCDYAIEKGSTQKSHFREQHRKQLYQGNCIEISSKFVNGSRLSLRNTKKHL